ncbi:hypothetical protein [Streptantibioticus ferralitis]|uniref:Uncharacterized protein n=1 Tax=Streptantibioticus ferralitis TaxID=236510 RepID=A0ABT5Z6I5_9ACTN|nr:hypothetical protein [Streptantibioticus ferralitis]MDF2259450.1 hypothetical protein [Streptantibioticus ferralitis]
MNPTMNPPAATAAMPRDVLSTLVAAVQEDPQGLPTIVQARVQRSQEADNVCMMGGWTA